MNIWQKLSVFLSVPDKLYRVIKYHYIFVVLISLIFLLSEGTLLTAQTYNWCNPVKLTGGNVDKNPRFNKTDAMDRITSNNYLIFERWYGTNSKICMIRMNNLGLVDSAVSVCDSSFKNINPCLGTDSRNNTITHLFFAWQRWNPAGNRYGLYGRYYNIYSGWSGIYAIDTSGNCENPDVVCEDSTRFSLVYSKNNDIILKRINAPTGAVLLDTNFTSFDTTAYRRPMISRIGDYYTAYALTYEKRMTGNYFSVRGRSKYQSNPWSGEVQLSGTTNPSENLGFALAVNPGRIFVYYFLDVIPSWSSQIICAEYNLQNNTFTTEFAIDTLDLNLSFSRMFDYIIIDKSQIVSQSVSTYICDKNNSNVYARFMNGSYTTQNIRIGSDYTKYRIALSNKFTPRTVSPPYAGVCTYWGVYNKDSAAYSCLWGSYTTKVLFIENIKKVGSEIPQKYSLSQNYPNPFNAVTQIEFGIKEKGNYSLRIYDVTGKMIQEVFKQDFEPGEYRTIINAGRLSSGVYFYRLESGSVVLTRKFVLMK